MQPPTHPAFRRLDLHRVEDSGQSGVVMVDPLGIATDQVLVPDGLMPVFSLFDGATSVEDIQRELESEHGQAVPEGLVEKLVQQMDEHLMLMSPRFEAALQEALARFSHLNARPHAHAGSAGYPADPNELREALGSMVSTSMRAQRDAPLGLVAPHIDLARGREGYAQAYGYLAECEPADLYVVFGTGHQGPSAIVTGLPMNWDTPLGEVPTDRGFVEAIHERLGPPDDVDLFLHRGEHSLEFQMVFLRHVLGERPFEVAGFLTGGLPGQDVAASEEARRVIAAFEEVAAASGKRVCYVAGADLAHVGPQFGDDQPLTAAQLGDLAVKERARLEHLEKGKPTEFHRSVEADGNEDRVCGTTPIYLTATLAGQSGEMLHYGQASEPDGSQMVSFCAMAFEA